MAKFEYIVACLLCLYMVLLPSVHSRVGNYEYQLFQQLLNDISANSNNTIQDRVTRNPSVLYLLYTRRNPSTGQILRYGDAYSITSSNFNPKVPTVLIMHGWLEDRSSSINPVLTDALLRNSEANVIVVDWSTLSRRDYFSSAGAVPSVGRQVGQFVSFLNQVTGLSYDNVHLVGFSLGAHVAGNAGRQLNGQVARITALDPAGPVWYANRNKLKKTDAVYVEALHTNAGEYGIEQAVADADFFPNGGSLQLGCAVASACNHYRSWQLFAASINNNHLIGRQCSSTFQLFADLCYGRSYPMGNNDLKKFGTGIYRLDTRGIYPY